MPDPIRAAAERTGNTAKWAVGKWTPELINAIDTEFHLLMERYEKLRTACNSAGRGHFTPDVYAALEALEVPNG